MTWVHTSAEHTGVREGLLGKRMEAQKGLKSSRPPKKAVASRISALAAPLATQDHMFMFGYSQDWRVS